MYTEQDGHQQRMTSYLEKKIKEPMLKTMINFAVGIFISLEDITLL